MEGKVNDAAAGNGKKEKKKAEFSGNDRLQTCLTAHFAEPFSKIHLFSSEHILNQTEPDSTLFSQWLVGFKLVRVETAKTT